MESKQTEGAHAIKKKLKKIPEVKMTRTAQLRLLKANPLLRYEVSRRNDPDIMKKLDLDVVDALTKSACALLDEVNNGNEKKLEFDGDLTTVKKYSISKSNSEAALKSPKMIKNLGALPRTVTVRPKLVPKKQKHPAEDVMCLSDDCKEVAEAQPCNRESIIESTGSEYSTPIISDMRRKLKDWLTENNKKSTFIKNLTTFPMLKIEIVPENNKENIDTSLHEFYPNHENLDVEEPTQKIAMSDLERVSKEALKDLNFVMKEGYSANECEQWLNMMKARYPQIVDEPAYWECKNLNEQMRCNGNQISKSNENQHEEENEHTLIQQSLTNLLEGFQNLDIQSSVSKSRKSRLDVDSQNAFTSTTIKFAVKDANKGKNIEEKSSSVPSSADNCLQATPVRRSTRVRKSGYISTPGVKICSLDEIDTNKVVFCNNNAL